MLLSNCVTCKSKKSRFMKEQETKGLLSTSVLKTSSVSMLRDILF